MMEVGNSAGLHGGVEVAEIAQPVGTCRRIRIAQAKTEQPLLERSQHLHLLGRRQQIDRRSDLSNSEFALQRFQYRKQLGKRVNVLVRIEVTDRNAGIER